MSEAPSDRVTVDEGLASPEARYGQREGVELALVAAMQHLPAKQRAALIYRSWPIRAPDSGPPRAVLRGAWIAGESKRKEQMFKETKAFSGYSVDDVAVAKEFYGETLGIDVSEENGILTLNIAGNRPTIIYPKGEQHQPASFTVLNFPVADIEAAVDEMLERGIEFERYESMEDVTDERGIMRGGGPLIAWFTDPAGNVLSVLQTDE